MKKAVFIPVYPGIKNAQLLKDCGMIPYFLHKNYGMDSYMLTTRREDYTYIDSYVKGLKIEYLEKGSMKEKVDFIINNGKTIDLLILFGGYEDFYAISHTYKTVNPEGKIYLALDANSGWMDRIEFADEYYTAFMNYCDVIATSCRAMARHLNEKWPWKVEYISNGFFNYYEKEHEVDFSRKNNTILTVGRLGTAQKLTDVLLESFAMISEKIPEWNLKLIGTIEKQFEGYIEKYYSKYPHLKERVIFTGPITDKLELFAEYDHSKIFALPSAFEGGTPNVISEALYNGNAVAVSEIDSYEDAIDFGKCGKSAGINDVKGFADILLELCNDEHLEEKCLYAHDYAKRNFNMSKNVDRLYEMLFRGV